MVCALLLTACSSARSVVAKPARPKSGGTATIAALVDEGWSWILPVPNLVSDEPNNMNFDRGMWLPLYTTPTGSKGTIDYARSMAYPPVYSDNDTVVTVTLKRTYKWSDGYPVTTRDVKFFYDLYTADKKLIGTYIPGHFPDDVKSIAFPTQYTFVIHLVHSYNPAWITNNQLTIIEPLPQQVWDRESLTGPDGNFASTPEGARRVFAFLTGQSEKVTTYSKNSLWQTVDGPWRLSSYNPVTDDVTFRANSRYTGPDRPYLTSYTVEEFSSETAELTALRAGDVTYGWLPISDYSLVSYFNSHGFTVAPWAPEDNQYAEFDYSSPIYGPLVRQLYIRQALQHLVNEQLYLRTAIHGFGLVDYGPVAPYPNSPYVSPEMKTDPDPYSLRDARELLEHHGWVLQNSGYMACERPGSSPTECGAGIVLGRQLRLLLWYTVTPSNIAAQAEAFQTAAKSVGVDVELRPESLTTIESEAGVCPPGPCDWGLVLWPWLWDYHQSDGYPTGGEMFGKDNYYGGGYYSPTAQHLIDLTHDEPGNRALFEYEDYVSRQIAGLWFPVEDDQVSVVSDTLHGWRPQSAFVGDFTPQDWYLSS